VAGGREGGKGRRVAVVPLDDFVLHSIAAGHPSLSASPLRDLHNPHSFVSEATQAGKRHIVVLQVVDEARQSDGASSRSPRLINVRALAPPPPQWPKTLFLRLSCSISPQPFFLSFVERSANHRIVR